MIPTPKELEGIVDRFSRLNVLVVGDAMLDHTIWGKTDKSPDLPELRWRLKVDREEHGLGGAANAAANVASLGGRSSLLFVTGNDEAGRLIDFQADQLGIGRHRIIEERRTVIKQRAYETNGVSPHYLGRIDFDEGLVPICSNTLGMVREHLARFRGSLNAVLIEDYAKGFVLPEVIAMVKEFANKEGIPLLVDPNRVKAYESYQGVSIFKPNRAEAGLYVPVQGRDGKQVAYDLSQRLGSEVVLTDGKSGMFVADRQGEVSHIPGVSIDGKVIDTVGAGDCVAAVLTLCAAAKVDVVSSAVIANVAAAVAISQGKVCGRPTAELLLKAYDEFYTDAKRD